MAYDPNETAEEFAKRVREQQGGKALGGKGDQIAPIPAKAAEAATPLNRAAGESLAQGQGTEMTYAEAMTRAAQYGHVPSQIGGGQPFNQAGGGPATMEQLNAIKGIWGIPTENGWVELGSLPDVTAVEAWTRAPSAARERNAPGSWVQDPATWKPTTPGGKQMIPVDPNFPLSKGFTTRPGVPGAPAMGALGAAAGATFARQGAAPQTAATFRGATPTTQPSRASAGGPVVPTAGLGGIAQQAQLPYWMKQYGGAPGPMSTNQPQPQDFGMNYPSLGQIAQGIGGAVQGALQYVLPTQNTQSIPPARTPAQYTLPTQNTQSLSPAPSPTGPGNTAAEFVNWLNALTIKNMQAQNPTGATPGQDWLRQAQQTLQEPIHGPATLPPSKPITNDPLMDYWRGVVTEMGQPNPRVANMQAGVDWQGGGGVQPWMKPPNQPPAPPLAPTAQQMQSFNQQVQNIPPWQQQQTQPANDYQDRNLPAAISRAMPEEGLLTQVGNFLDKTVTPFYQNMGWGAQNPPEAAAVGYDPNQAARTQQQMTGRADTGYTPPMVSVINMNPANATIPDYLKSAATFGQGISQGAMNASAPLWDLGNPGGGGFPMGKTRYAPSSMSNANYPYSPLYRR